MRGSFLLAQGFPFHEANGPVVGWLVALAVGGCLLSGCGDDGEPPARANVQVFIGPSTIAVESPVLKVIVQRNPFRLEFAARDQGDPLTRTAAHNGLFYRRGNGAAEVTAVGAATAEHAGVRLTVETGEGEQGQLVVAFVTERTVRLDFVPPRGAETTAVGASWESPGDERIYGLTERLRDSPPLLPGVVEVPQEEARPREVGSLDRRGETVEMFVRPTIAVYAPFYQSSRGYGLSVAGTMPGLYDLAATEPNTVSFVFESGSRPENQHLTMFLFYGPEFSTILDEYTRLTGRPLVAPAWAFLHWRWRDELPLGPPGELDGVPINAAVAEDVLMYEQLGIPSGVYLLDRPVLQGNFGFARFAWDEDRLPNARAMLDALRRRGYRLVTWSAAWVCGSNPGDNGYEAQQLGFIAPMRRTGAPFCDDVRGRNFILDVTNPAAREWFQERLARFLRDEGIDGIKLDRGEEHIPSERSDIWADGRSGREVHNDYVVLQTRMHREALDLVRPDGNYVLIARAGYTGTQADSIVWGGDTAGSEDFGEGAGTDLGMRSAIISQQRAAFLGFPIWGSDTGGYYQFKHRDVFARWIEFSAFSGIMEIGGKGSHAPWDMPTEPKYDTEMIDIYRRYTRLRHALQPYIVAAARDARRGLPLVRPMPFLDPSDRELQDRWDQYLFGPDLMVAPVWRIGQRERVVYFPRGRWRNFWDTDEVYEGPAWVRFPVPLDTILVFLRDGAVHPVEKPPS
ncbi:Alpha-xylosidase [bacterium HR30]|nr:Alpha-xylosidase [bacterium HR30]